MFFTGPRHPVGRLPVPQVAGNVQPKQPAQQGAFGAAARPAPLLAPKDMAEQLRLKEERQEAERAAVRARQEQERKRAEVFEDSPPHAQTFYNSLAILPLHGASGAGHAADNMT
jgi:hypothetical protein